MRVLQERKVRPLGSNRDIDIDVRIISATHRDLPKAMARGEFREDLYYRLNVVSLKIPALALWIAWAKISFPVPLWPLIKTLTSDCATSRACRQRRAISGN